MRILKPLLVVGCALGLGSQVQAGLQIPYTPNDNTTHLWHFDGAYTNADGTLNTNTPDDVPTGGITLTNLTQTQIPGSTITLGNASLAGLNNCLHIIATNLATGNTYAFASGGSVADSTLINSSSGGAFTFEAVVKMDISPFATTGSAQNWEIICGDSSANGSGVRGWQFRITTGTSASINFNAAPGVNAAVNNITVPLPNSGPDAVAADQWYHVAVTFTGSSPTNSDPANLLTFYWTLLDANRTYADVLTQMTVQSGFGILSGVTAALGVGGSGRGNNGVANNEGFKGYIDEARMSIVALQSNEMAFTTGGALNPPVFLAQPATNTFLGYGQMLTLSTLVSGTSPLAYQWYQNGTVPLVGQTNNTLATNVTFASAGNYTLVATNNYGSKTSLVAQVSIGATFSELYDTGVDTNGALLAGGAGVYDPHYTLIQSADASYLGPNATVWDMTSAPTKANSGRFQNADGVSQWIGPTTPVAEAAGSYTYRTHFLIDQATVSTAQLQGTYWVNVSDVNVILNGVSQGVIPADLNNNPGTLSFTVTNGLVAGLNTLDFVTTNLASAQDTESALRVELSGLGQALAAGKPVIASQPVSQSVHDGNQGGQSEATFAVVALGRPPLSYQWWADGAPLSDATNRTLQFISPTAGGQGVNYSVVVVNDSGSVTSSVASLTILTTNQPPFVPAYSYTIYSNTTLNISIDALYSAASDADNDPLSIYWDGGSANGASVVQTDINLVYTPLTDYLGADSFNYYVSDGIDQVTGPININIVPLVAPSVLTAAKAGANMLLAGVGASAQGSFHILSSTNLLTPLTNWVSTLATNFDASGNFSVSMPVPSGVPQTFYLIAVP